MLSKRRNDLNFDFDVTTGFYCIITKVIRHKICLAVERYKLLFFDDGDDDDDDDGNNGNGNGRVNKSRVEATAETAEAHY